MDNWRWAGVPFYLRSGKRLASKLTMVANRLGVFGVDYCLSKAAVPVRRSSWGAALILSSALCAAEEPSSVNGTLQHAGIAAMPTATNRELALDPKPAVGSFLVSRAN